MIKKITSVLYVLLVVGVFASTLKQPSHLVDWISTFTILLFLISSVGDAFNLKMGKKTSWKLSWIVSVIYNLVYIFYLDHRFGAQHGTPSSDLLGFLIFAPVIYMSYHFAFSRSSVKSKKTHKKNFHKGNNNQTLNNEPFISIGLRKLKSALESGWRLPPQQ